MSHLKAFANLGIFSVFGSDKPLSHLETDWNDTSISSANFSCVSLFTFL